jgi:hypothetical protein
MATYVAQANTGEDQFQASRSINKPGGVSAGDVGVFWLVRWNESSNFPAVTAPDGAVLRATIQSGTQQTLCYIMTVGAETSYAFSWSSSRWSTLSGTFFSGVDTSQDYSAVPLDSTNGNGTTVTTLSVTTVADAALVWHVCSIDTNPSGHTPPTSFTEVSDVPAATVAYRISPGAGSQSAANGANSSSSSWLAGLVALAPVDDGPSDEEVGEAETGSSNETQSSTASFALTEDWTGSDDQAVTVLLGDSDSASGSETQSTVQGAIDGDSSGGSEGETVNASLTVSGDTGTGTESQTLNATLSTSGETGTGSESQTIGIMVSSSDSVTATESDEWMIGTTTTPSSNEGAGGGESEHVQKYHAPVQEGSLVLGPATLYIAPYGAVEPANGSVGSDPNPAVWTLLGGTLGGVELVIEQEYVDVELKQLPDKPMRRLKRRRLSIKTQLAEPTLANLAYVMNDTAPTSGVFLPSNRSEASVLDYSALIVDGWNPGIHPGGRHKRRRLIARKCLSVDNVQMSYSKDGQTVYTVTWTCHYVDSSTPAFRVVDEA